MNKDYFKVRIWNVSGRYYLPDFYLTPAGEVCEFGVFNGTPMVRKFNNQENFLKERCTGLRDRNDKLIYEGDVVRWHRSTAWGLGGERKGHVFWHDKFGSFGVRSTLGDGFSICEIGECEIIGNVHENGGKR